MKRRRTSAAVALAMDHGSTGPAMLARPSRMVPSDAAGVEYRQVFDANPMPGLHLSDRQAEAAIELTRLWRASLRGMERPKGFRTPGIGGGEMTAADEKTAGEAYRAYNDAIDAVQWQCGLQHVIALRATIIHHEQRDIWRVREALDVLATHLFLK